MPVVEPRTLGHGSRASPWHLGPIQHSYVRPPIPQDEVNLRSAAVGSTAHSWDGQCYLHAAGPLGQQEHLGEVAAVDTQPFAHSLLLECTLGPVTGTDAATVLLHR